MADLHRVVATLAALIVGCGGRASTVGEEPETGADTGLPDETGETGLDVADLPVEPPLDLPSGPFPGEPCTDSTDCDAGLECRPFPTLPGIDTYTHLCIHPGELGLGEPCELTTLAIEAFTSPCATGLVCNLYRCTTLCEGSCPSPQTCTATQRPRLGEHEVCRLGCGPDGLSCPTGMGCVIYAEPGPAMLPEIWFWEWGCAPTGFGDFGMAGEVPPGSVCFDSVAMPSTPGGIDFECRRPCYVANDDCPAGQVCTPHDAWGVSFANTGFPEPDWDGVCLPP